MLMRLFACGGWRRLARRSGVGNGPSIEYHDRIRDRLAPAGDQKPGLKSLHQKKPLVITEAGVCQPRQRTVCRPWPTIGSLARCGFGLCTKLGRDPNRRG